MQELQLSEIQGFLTRDYRDMPFAKYFLLQLTDAAKAKEFLKNISKKITIAVSNDEDSYTNIGFTDAGFTALGLLPNNLRAFVREFREGMVTPYRQRLLGDHESNDPAKWNWGGPNNDEIHIVIMIFDKDHEKINVHADECVTEFSKYELRNVFVLDNTTFPEGREHFGFRESISQPVIIGSDATGHKNDHIKAGEFVLGYKNEYGVYPDTPLL